METPKRETETPSDPQAARPEETPHLQPEMVTIGKVKEITHGGGRIWGDGQKNAERQ